MEIRFCKHYSFGNKTFTNYEFDDNGEVNYCMLRAKQQWWNEVLYFKDISLRDVLIDLGIPEKYLVFVAVAGDFTNVTFKRESTIDFGLGDYSDPKVKDFIEGRTSELVLDIKEEI